MPIAGRLAPASFEGRPAKCTRSFVGDAVDPGDADFVCDTDGDELGVEADFPVASP